MKLTVSLIGFFIFNTCSIYAAIRPYLEYSKVVESKIEEVTIYSGKAEIKRMVSLGNFAPKKSNTWIHLGPLPQDLIKNTIKIKSDYRVLQTVIEDFYDYSLLPSHVIEKKKKLENLYAQRLDILQKKMLKDQELNFLESLRFNSWPSPMQDYPRFESNSKTLEVAIDQLYFAKSASFEEVLKLKNQLENNREMIDLLINELQNYSDLKERKWMTHLFILLEQNQSLLSDKLEYSYMINNAQWTPSYDLRVELNQKKGAAEIKLITSGLVTQSTGEFWDGVSLKLSTLDPYPLFPRILDKWVFKEIRTPVVKMSRSLERSKKKALMGQTAGSIEMTMDEAHEPSMSAPLMPERADTLSDRSQAGRPMPQAPPQIRMQKNEAISSLGIFPMKSLEAIFAELSSLKGQMGQIQSKLMEGKKWSVNDSNFSKKQKGNSFSEVQGQIIEMRSPFKANIQSHMGPIKIPLQTQNFTGELRYFSIPKMDKKVFLKAKILNTTKVPLLNGPAQIYMNGDLVSKTHLSHIGEESRFDVDLGVDDNIEIQRIVEKKSDTQGLIVKSHKTNVDVKIEIMNHHNFPIIVDLKDQFPLTPHEDLKIELLSVVPKESKNQDGILTWDGLRLAAKGNSTIKFNYVVEHPKDWIVSEFN